MFNQLLVCKTAFNVVQLPPYIDGVPTLIAEYPGSLQAFDSEECALGYEFDKDQQTLTLSYFSLGERVGFILDPWCDETVVMLTKASSAGYVLVALSGDEATSTYMCCAAGIWDEMLALVHGLRGQTQTVRPLARFLPDAMLVVIDHAYYPHVPARADADIGARSMNVVLTQAHLQAMYAD